MLPRAELKEETDRLQAKYNESTSPELAAAMQRSREMFERVGWGGRESSMITAAQMPIVSDMLNRLRVKYAAVLEAKSTDVILGELETHIRKQIKIAEKARDRDLVYHLTKALAVLIAPDSILRKDIESTMHGENLRDVMALMWLAASDVNAVLTPARERELLKLPEHERPAARAKIVWEEGVGNTFISTMHEIRREHNNDNEQWRRDKVNDHPSCPGGTFGRLVMNTAPLNCAAALCAELGLPYKAYEQQSLQIAACELPPLNFAAIPRLCEDFICMELEGRSPDFKEAVYRSFNEFINADVEDQDQTAPGSQMNEARLAEHKRIHALFAASLTSTECFERLLSFMDEKMPGIAPAIFRLNAQDAVKKLFAEYAKSISPASLFEKDFFMVYANEDQRFIDNMRKVGAAIVKKAAIGDSIFTDPDIIHCRVQIHNVYERLRIIHQSIMNETKFALLAYHDLLEAPATRNRRMVKEASIPEENKQKWVEICKAIQDNIAGYREEIIMSLQPELRNYVDQLDDLLKVKKKAAEEKAAADMHEEVKVPETELAAVDARTKQTSAMCERMLDDVRTVSQAIDMTVKVSEQPNFTVTKLNKQLGDLVAFEQNNQLLQGPKSWASALIMIAQSRLPAADKADELKHFNQFVDQCGGDGVRAAIARELPAVFNAMRTDNNDKSSWQLRLKSLKLLDEMLPGQDISGLCLATLKDVKWHEEIVRIAQSRMTQKEKIADLRQIQQFLQNNLKPEEYQKALKLIGKAFEASCKDGKNTVTWRERREAIRLLTDVFAANKPDEIPGDNIGLRCQALRSFQKIEESGRALFANSEQSKQVFECAAQPLLLAVREPEPKLIDPALRQQSLNAWLNMAKQLVGLEGDNKGVPDKTVDISKVEQLVLVTLCRNFGLTDMRCEDMAMVRKICRTYLQNSNEVKNMLFGLQPDDTLEKRLNYLTVHLAAMITTLKPVAALYNTGHVRIMDMDVAATQLEDYSRVCCIVRTSSGNPATLTVSDLNKDAQVNHERLLYSHKDKEAIVRFENVDVTLPDNTVKRIPVINLFNYHAKTQKAMYEQSMPTLVLLPFSQLLHAEYEIKDDHKHAEGAIRCGYEVDLVCSGELEDVVPSKDDNKAIHVLSGTHATAFHHAPSGANSNNDPVSTPGAGKK